MVPAPRTIRDGNGVAHRLGLVIGGGRPVREYHHLRLAFDQGIGQRELSCDTPPRKRHTEHNEALFALGSTSVGTEYRRFCSADVSPSAKGVKALQALPVPEAGEHAVRRCLWCRDFDLARPCPGSP